MTIKEVADILNVSRDLIEKRVNELFPTLMKRGVTTYLNEPQITAIKLRIQQNSSLATSDNRRRLSEMPQTDLEKELIIQQAMQLQAEKIQSLQSRVDRLIHDNRTYTVSEIAKEMNFNSAQELNKILYKKGIQYLDSRGTWLLYSEYAGRDFTRTKQREINGKPRYYTEWTGLGRDWLLGLNAKGELCQE